MVVPLKVPVPLTRVAVRPTTGWSGIVIDEPLIVPYTSVAEPLTEFKFAKLLICTVTISEEEGVIVAMYVLWQDADTVYVPRNLSSLKF